MPDTSLTLDPVLYRETLQQLDLRAVRLRELKTLCHHPVVGQAHIDISMEAGSRREDDELLIDAIYKIEATNESDKLFTIEVTFVVVLTAPGELPDGFVEAYIANNLNLTVFPYVRELAGSITARMGLPALTLPYMLNQHEKAPDKPKRRSRKPKAAE